MEHRESGQEPQSESQNMSKSEKEAVDIKSLKPRGEDNRDNV